MTKTDTKKRLRIYIIAAVILVIIAGAAAFVWYRFGSVKVSCMLDDGSVTETRLSRGDSFVFPQRPPIMTGTPSSTGWTQRARVTAARA